MSNIAIRVDGLGKKYRLGTKRQSYGSLRESLTGAAAWASHLLRHPWGSGGSGKRKPDFWALRNVGFELRDGEVLGIIGRNGAGKSTLLKLLSEITEPTTGRIEVSGRVASLLEVGTGFHPELSGRENIYLNGAILGMGKAEIRSKFDEIVAFAEVDQFIDTQVKHFSSGMYMRLAFAVAAHLEPEILVVDEVLAVGDTAFQKKCLGKMEDVSHTGKTVLFVSHNMESIRRLCTRGLLLSSGQVKEFGDIGPVVDTYVASSMIATASRSTKTEFNPAEFYVESIEILDLAGNPKDLVATWDSVRFRITYHAPHALKSGCVCFQLGTRTGVILTYSSTQPDRTIQVEMREGLNVIDCVFPRLALSAGWYTMGAGIAIPNVEMLYDGLDSWDLEVLSADVFHSGLAPNSRRYVIAQEHSWEPM